jgi:hypothetical protein
MKFQTVINIMEKVITMKQNIIFRALTRTAAAMALIKNMAALLGRPPKAQVVATASWNR